MVSVDYMLILILSSSFEALEMPCAEAVKVLAPWVFDLKPDHLPSPLCLMNDFRKPNSSCVQFCLC